MNELSLAFITGLTTGGFSCIAVQGGLLASVVAQHKEKSSISTISVFLIAKIAAYTLLGFGLGVLGSRLSLTPTIQGWMQIVAGIYMLITVANLLNLHPVFRYFVIAPPRFVYKFMRAKTKEDSLFTPALLGFLTVLIPCGVTQGMMVFAVASANPILGAGIMAAFILGTSPVFAIVGFSASQLLKRKTFVYLASLVILYLGIISINTGQILRGSPHTLQNYWRVITSTPEEVVNGKVASINTEGKQEVIVDVKSSGYSTSVKSLKAGVPVRLVLKTDKTFGCSRAFTIPSMNISKVLPETGEEILEFTPTKPGRLSFSCSMGMFDGEFIII